MPTSIVENIDCMIGMARYPDKYFDLAIVDPPYGTFDASDKIERTGGSWSKKYQRDNNIKNWDFAPPPEYFEELKRVSKNQIIWGANYFTMPPCRCFIIWEKITISEKFTMAMCEFAYTTFNSNAKIFKHRPQREDGGIHPTQKPVALYKWLLTNYATDGNKILDTHLGSGSSRIAAHDMGFDFTGFELDKDYFEAAEKRYQNHIKQLTMF
jgi:site-specific DNA-methyltransferase (adenine-specific)